ncbi:MAG: hypothetical protein KTR32_16025 [Granulosicoccus sp.]|nr:hypothetical protein [Granulosicoccus sp.]
MRLYLEHYCDEADQLEQDTTNVLKPLYTATIELIRLQEFAESTEARCRDMTQAFRTKKLSFVRWYA